MLPYLVGKWNSRRSMEGKPWRQRYFEIGWCRRIRGRDWRRCLERGWMQSVSRQRFHHFSPIQNKGRGIMGIWTVYLSLNGGHSHGKEDQVSWRSHPIVYIGAGWYCQRWESTLLLSVGGTLSDEGNYWPVPMYWSTAYCIKATFFACRSVNSGKAWWAQPECSRSCCLHSLRNCKEQHTYNTRALN